MIHAYAVTDCFTYRELAIKTMVFPGGEVHVNVEQDVPADEISIKAHVTNSVSLMTLLMVTDALRRLYPGLRMVLRLPYVPYARQDRVANAGEALSLKVFCDIINAQKYERVIIQDPHSDVVAALLDCPVIEDPLPALTAAMVKIAGPVALVAPDAGARKRVLSLARALGGLPVVFADKYRDTQTGAITGTCVSGDVPDLPLLVVDDICDGGWTFLELAKALRAKQQTQGSNNPLYLYVTHGIFSKGLDSLLAQYETVFTRNNWTSDARCELV